MTRNAEYKRSVHNASSRVPLLIHGPGFEGAQQITQIVGLIDLDTDAAGGSRRRSAGDHEGPQLDAAAARRKSACRVAERTTDPDQRVDDRARDTHKDWTYCVAEITGTTNQMAATTYQEYQMYDQRNDPYEQCNLAGRKEFRQQANELQAKLKKLLVAAGEPEPEIRPARLYP